nr:MAG TPA: tail connector protein [Caudoviricetes sp.]
MAIQASDILAVIQSRPQTIPAGLDDAAIQSYIDEAKPIMLEYCTLPQNIQEVPSVLKYPWVEIATALMNNSTAESYTMSTSNSAPGAIKSISDGDTSIQFSGASSSVSTTVNRAAALNSVSANNIRIMDGFRTLF